MARIDDEAAEQELEKASQCDAQADQLIDIANALRQRARRHVKEADDLRGRRNNDDRLH